MIDKEKEAMGERNSGFVIIRPCASNLGIKKQQWGAWVAQSVKRLTSAQVTISPFVGSSPALGPVLTVESLEPALDSVSPSLSNPSLTRALSLSVSQRLNKR